jgi:hypothetical protein
MSDPVLETPEQLRDKAERCLRLASNLSSKRDVEKLEEYARELLEEAERLETARR